MAENSLLTIANFYRELNDYSDTSAVAEEILPKGVLAIYPPETAGSSVRIKIGDGKTSLKDTPFAAEGIDPDKAVVLNNTLTANDTTQLTKRLIVGGEGTKKTGTYTASIGTANDPKNQKSALLVGNNLTSTSYYQTVVGQYNNPKGANARPFVIGWGSTDNPVDIVEVSSSGKITTLGGIEAHESISTAANFKTTGPGITGPQLVNVSNANKGYINVGAFITEVNGNTGHRALNFVHGQTAGGNDSFSAPGIFGSYNTVLGQLKNYTKSLTTPAVGDYVYIQNNETKEVERVIASSTDIVEGVYVCPEGYTRVEANITGDYNIVTGDLNGTILEGHWNAILGSGGNNKLYSDREYVERDASTLEPGDTVYIRNNSTRAITTFEVVAAGVIPDNHTYVEYINDPPRHNLVVGSANEMHGTENSVIVGQQNYVGNLPRANAIGKGLRPTRADSLVIGTYNDWIYDGNPRDNIVFGVGIGTSDEHRQNAFTVWKGGTVSAGSNPVAPMDLVTLNYLKTYVKTETDNVSVSCACTEIPIATINSLFTSNIDDLIPEYSATIENALLSIRKVKGLTPSTGIKITLDIYETTSKSYTYTHTSNDAKAVSIDLNKIAKENHWADATYAKVEVLIQADSHNIGDAFEQVFTFKNILIDGSFICKNCSTVYDTREEWSGCAVKEGCPSWRTTCATCGTSYTSTAAKDQCKKSVNCTGFVKPIFEANLASDGTWSITRTLEGTTTDVQYSIENVKLHYNAHATDTRSDYSTTNLGTMTTISNTLLTTGTCTYQVDLLQNGYYYVSCDLKVSTKTKPSVVKTYVVTSNDLVYKITTAGETPICPSCDQADEVLCNDPTNSTWMCRRCQKEFIVVESAESSNPSTECCPVCDGYNTVFEYSSDDSQVWYCNECSAEFTIADNDTTINPFMTSCPNPDCESDNIVWEDSTTLYCNTCDDIYIYVGEGHPGDYNCPYCGSSSIQGYGGCVGQCTECRRYHFTKD